MDVSPIAPSFAPPARALPALTPGEREQLLEKINILEDKIYRYSKALMQIGTIWPQTRGIINEATGENK